MHKFNNFLYLSRGKSFNSWKQEKNSRPNFGAYYLALDTKFPITFSATKQKVKAYYQSTTRKISTDPHHQKQ